MPKSKDNKLTKSSSKEQVDNNKTNKLYDSDTEILLHSREHAEFLNAYTIDSV